MAVKVVDASALAALHFGEPDRAQVAAQLTGAALTAPALLPFELANVCVTKIRRDPHLRPNLLASFDLLSGMDIALEEVELDAVIMLAETARLSAYGASYLWLAQELGAELVTLDRRLQQAAATFRLQ